MKGPYPMLNKGSQECVFDYLLFSRSLDLDDGLARFSIKMVQVSYAFGELSQGSAVTPLWIPQLRIAIGSTIFAIALLDRLVAVARGAPIEKIGGEPAAVE